MREDAATPWSLCAAILGVAVAVALVVGGGVAYRLGGARSVQEVIVPDIRLMAMPVAVRRDEVAAKAAADPVPERRLREFQEAFAKVWRAGLEDTATETETEPTGGTATAAVAAGVAADAPAATAGATATAGSAATATATATATAPAIVTAEPVATTAATASAASALAAATTTATAASPIATTTASGAASIASATTDPPTASATAAAEPAAWIQTAPVATDASPNDVRVVMYTTSWCVVCKRAKAWMVRHGVAFEDRDVEASPEYMQELLLLAQRELVPTFDVEGDVMIGFSPSRLLAMVQAAKQKKAEGPG